MSIQILTLAFVSPLIAYSIHLILKESKDALEGFHEDFIKEKFPTSGASHEIQMKKNQKKNLISELISRRKLELSIWVMLLITSLYLGGEVRMIVFLISCLCIFCYWDIGAAARRTAKVNALIELELPSIVELFSILVSSGASPAVALLEITEIAEGEFANILNEIKSDLKHGGNLRAVLEVLSRSTNSGSFRRFCDSLIIAIERGTALNDVLSRQVEELRSSQKASLIRQASRVEIALMIPVVFLILPISILFALWPSYVALGTSIN